ncbi:class I adenylate-forming enzyme family protein [Rhodophyticola porphyridii]|uniref:Long-chain fatty acid--CoA ligase n=1 Tax=Rhodophyticola porphyridii TaxID=1852017 RepID=A0A3L9Y963_9RHOB|nr:AMP-binding protein [Rhodophyticola porphyridii]RMA43677.1 long-chain fatty acid--CoA ligase [Rhodophyticola porphyridii]
MNTAQWLLRTAGVAGDCPALMRGAEPVASYAEFAARAEALARALADGGLMPGDRIGLFMTNCPDYLIVCYGVWLAGGVVVPINAKLHAKEAAWIVKDSGARGIFVTPDLAEAFAAETDTDLIDISGSRFARMISGGRFPPVSRGSDDLAWLFYTSGTTGKPKGVQITHGMLAATSLCYPIDVDPVSPEDAAYYAAPMSHGAGLYALIHVRMGARHICPVGGGFDPVELLELSERLGPTSMFLAPTMVRRLTDAAKATGRDGSGIKTIIYGGGPMYLADIEEAVDWFGPKFVQIYGQGECPMAISSLSRVDVADRTHPNWRARLASVGRAQSMVEIVIGDDTGTPLPHGTPGEIMVRGAPVMPGYWNAPDTTVKTLKDGWLMTGDIGQLDADGYLTLQDRSKDVIISGGSNIYPREIEEVLLQHPSVHEVSVVGRASAEWGEEVVAFVVSAPGEEMDPAVLEAHCIEYIARFKRPKCFISMPDLPKNNYGKILKTELRRFLEEEA